MVEEKGTYWSKLTVRGTPATRRAVPDRQRARHRGRGRAPARRVPGPSRSSSGTWQRLVAGARAAPELAAPGAGFRRVRSTELPLGLARIAHSCTHTTFAPTVVHGGTKTNVIPDRVDLEVDIRTLPGPERARPRASCCMEAIGDLADKVEIESDDDPSTASAIDTPLWDALGARHRRGSARARRWCRGS